MRSRFRKGVLGVVVAAMTLSCVALPGTANAHPRPPKDPAHDLVKAVSGKKREQYLKVLQVIAKVNNDTGCPAPRGFDLSRDYVAGKLRAAGYQVTVQPFEFLFEGYRTPPVLQRTSPDPKTYTYGFFSDDVAMGDSPAGSASGQTQAVDLVLPPGPAPGTTTPAARRADFAGFTAGTSRSMQRGTCNFLVKAQNAQAAGAGPPIMFNEGQPGRTETLRAPSVSHRHHPVVGISFAVGAGARRPGRHRGHAQLTPIISRNATTYNVIAETKGGDPTTWSCPARTWTRPGGAGHQRQRLGQRRPPGGRGQLARSKPKNKCASPGGGPRSSGLLGRPLRRHLTEEQREKIALYLNFDMIGSPNYTLRSTTATTRRLRRRRPGGLGGDREAVRDTTSACACHTAPISTAAPTTGRSSLPASLPAACSPGPRGQDRGGGREVRWHGGHPLTLLPQACDTTATSTTGARVNTDAIATLPAMYAFNTGTIGAGAPAPAGAALTMAPPQHGPADSLN